MSRQLGPCLNFKILIIVLILSPTNAKLTTIVDPAAEGFGNHVCVTKECAKIAAMLILNMDEKVKPCDDFTGFVCGNYDLRYDVKPRQDYHTPAHSIGQALFTRLQLLFEAPPSPADKPWHALTKTYYQKCIDKAAIKANGEQAIFGLLDEIGGWPMIEPQWQEFSTSWEEYMGMVNQKYDDSFLKWKLETNLYNVSEYVLHLKPSYLDDPREFAHEFAGFLDVDTDLFAKLKILLDGFVSALGSEISTCSGEQTGPLKLLKEEFPHFDLETYVRRLLDGIIPVSPDLTITISCLNVFENLHHIAKHKRDLASFVGLKAALQIYKEGVENCVGYTANKFLEPVAQMYTTKYFDYDGVAPKVKEMIALIRESLHETINNATWLDDPTRQHAIKKLKEMKEIVAYSDTLFNDTIMNQKWNIPFDPTDHFYTLSARVKHKKLANKLATWNKTPKFDMIDNDVNAYHTWRQNGIYVGAAILELPYYQSNVPDYVNFAGIGHVIAHEFMHGFDNNGRLYDEKGNYRGWWTKNTSEKYEAKAQCYVEQYDNHGLNGENTLGENIADNVGGKVTYYAYKKHLMRQGVETEPALPGFEKYTLDQMFFMLQANKMCDVMTKGPLRNPNDPHARSHMRAKITAKNMKDYSRAFHCPKGSPMNPQKKCSIWQQ
uniref:Neprilysin n=1 Tax=Panagrellus redivivus TaxID=6233 RepID=A0A7E4UU81_PANRE